MDAGWELRRTETAQGMKAGWGTEVELEMKAVWEMKVKHVAEVSLENEVEWDGDEVEMERHAFVLHVYTDAESHIRVRVNHVKPSTNTTQKLPNAPPPPCFLPGGQITAHSHLPGFHNHSWPILYGHKILELVF